MDYSVHGAQENAQDVLNEALEEDHTAVYTARGCDYEVAVYDTPDMMDGVRMGVRVACFSFNGDRNGKHVWSCGATVGPDDRMVDVIREARRNRDRS